MAATDAASPSTTAAAYTAEEAQLHVAEAVQPLRDQIGKLLKAVKEASDRENTQNDRLKKMEGEKAKQEEVIGLMKKRLKIKTEDDDLTTDEEDEEKEDAKKIKNIKGFDVKAAPKPYKYGGM